MVPSACVLLNRLPLTPNGKLDRKALPAPDQERGDLVYAAPRTPLEEVLAAVWAEVIGIDQIGVRDNFFDLRGHSLLAVRVIARLEDIFPIELPLRLIFEAPTVEELARRIEALGAAMQLDIINIAQLFIRLNQLSDDEVSRMLAEQSV